MRSLLVLLALSIASIPALASAAFGISSSSGLNYIDNTGGAITDFSEGALEDPGNLAFLINEGVATTEGFGVDHNGAPGTYTTFSQLSSKTLDAGQYASYLVHFDPFGQPDRHVKTFGQVTFDEQTRIVGLALLPGADVGIGSSPNTLAATDAIFGPDYTYYTSFAFRGLELGNSTNPDGFRISSDGRTFSFDTETLGFSAARMGIDEVRLILQAVPEVSSIVAWSMVAGLALVVWCVHSKRTRRVAVVED